ncbi:MAG: hypothetical protein ILO43_03410 [Clostridia bacterium]|nr:hypothetical protein [Clostridia bacterium]
MAIKDMLDRFKREPEEELPEEVPEEQPSFIFTDINSEPIVPETPAVEEPPVRSGPVEVESTNGDRIKMFEIDLGGSKVKLPEEAPVVEPPVVEPPVIEEPPVYAPAAPAEPPVPKQTAAGEEAEDYEVDFGYAAPGALDDMTFSKNPKAAKPAEPEPVVYQRKPAEEPDEEEYYDSYEPIYEEPAPGTYFAGAAPSSFDEVAPPVHAAPPEEVPEEPEAPAPEEEFQPRYENYRKDYQAKAATEGPRTYENNIDETVFLPDEGDRPLNSRTRRRITIASIIAILLALLLVLVGIFVTRHNRAADEAAATTAKPKTTAFERSVSNNSDATETTTEEPSAEYDENGMTSSSSTSVTQSSSYTSRRTSTTTSRTTTSRTTTRSTTRSTTASTTASTTEATTAEPPTTPPTAAPTPTPTPWDNVNQ